MYGFWYHLECSGQTANIKVSLKVACEQTDRLTYFTIRNENFYTFFTTIVKKLHYQTSIFVCLSRMNLELHPHLCLFHNGVRPWGDAPLSYTLVWFFPHFLGCLFVELIHA